MRTEAEVRARLERLKAAVNPKRPTPVALTMEIVTLEWVLGLDSFGEDES